MSKETSSVPVPRPGSVVPTNRPAPTQRPSRVPLAWIPRSSSGAAVAALAWAATGQAALAEFDAQKYLAFGFGHLSLRPRLEVSEMYDSNLFFEQSGEDSDFITAVRPGFNLTLGTGGDTYSSLTYSTEITRYIDHEILNYLGHTVTHQAQIQLKRAVITGTDSFTQTRSTLGGTFSYLQRPVQLRTLRDQWRMDYDISPKAMAGVDFGFEWFDYDASDLGTFALYDATLISGALRAGYIPSDRLVIYPQFSYSHSLLTANQPSLPDAPSLTAYGMGLGVQGEFTPKLSGTISGGYEFREFSDSTEAPDGWVSAVTLRWTPRAKTTVALAFRHWIQAVRDARQTAVVADRPSIRVDQELGTQGRWTLGAEAYYQIQDYGDGFLSGNTRVRRSDDLFGILTSVGFRWTAWLSAAAVYDFSTYTDNIPAIPDYEVHRISLRITAGY